MKKYIKMGTIFKWMIRPAVWAYDRFWGTDMLDCEVCAAREKEMNDDFWGFVRKLLTNKK